MMPAFTLFGMTLYPYALLMIAGVGVMCGGFVVRTFARHRDSLDENLYAIEMLIVATAAALPAAVLFDSLLHFFETGKFRFGSATFYGGLLAALPLWSLLLFLKRRKTVCVSARLDDLAPFVPAGHALGRIGCFFGGCCYGKPTSGPFGVVFPPGSLPYAAYGATPLHPTQLYEAACLIVIFLILIKCRHAFPLYLILYGTARFCIEFLRSDDRGGLPAFPLSPAQCISLLLFLVGIVLLVFRLGKSRTRC